MKTQKTDQFTDNSGNKYILRAEQKSLLTVNLFAALSGIFILYFFISLPNYGITFFISGTAILLIWLLADFAVWKINGIREIQIGSSHIGVIRGEDRKETIISADQITDFHVHTSGARKSVNIMLERKVLHTPGIMTSYPGKRIHFTSDAFSSREFDEAIELIRKIYSEKSQQL